MDAFKMVHILSTAITFCGGWTLAHGVTQRDFATVVQAAGLVVAGFAIGLIAMWIQREIGS